MGSRGRTAAQHDETAPVHRQAGRGPAGATQPGVFPARAHRRPPASLVSEEARPVAAEHVDDNHAAAVDLWLSRLLLRQQGNGRENLPLPRPRDVSPAHGSSSFAARAAGWPGSPPRQPSLPPRLFGGDAQRVWRVAGKSSDPSWSAATCACFERLPFSPEEGPRAKGLLFRWSNGPGTASRPSEKLRATSRIPIPPFPGACTLFPRTGASRKTFSACQSTRWGRNRRCPAPRLAPSSSSGPWLSSGC